MKIDLRLLGVSVTPMASSDVWAHISAAALERRRSLIVGHNLHSIYLCHTNEEMSRAYSMAEVILVDGQPVRWAGRLSREGQASDWSPEKRIGSVDWLTATSPAAIKRIAVVGGSSDSNSRFCELFQEISNSEVVGITGYPWSADRRRRVVADLTDLAPDLILIGLGMPLQEAFVVESWDSLPAVPIALVGGAIDQIAGVQIRSPRWMSRFGLEWLWRMCRDPRRLGHRYMVEPIQLALLLLRNRRHTSR